MTEIDYLDKEQRITDALRSRGDDAPSSKYFRIARLVADKVKVVIEADEQLHDVINPHDEVGGMVNARDTMAMEMATYASFRDFSQGTTEELEKLINAVRG